MNRQLDVRVNTSYSFIGEKKCNGNFCELRRDVALRRAGVILLPEGPTLSACLLCLKCGGVVVLGS